MAITVIRGPVGSGRQALAQTLRAYAVSERRGTLILSEVQADADRAVLVEKIIEGDRLPENVADNAVAVKDETGKFVVRQGLDSVKWKKDPHVIVVAPEGLDILREIEQLVPGFIERFGPATGVSTVKEEIDLGPEA